MSVYGLPEDGIQSLTNKKILKFNLNFAFSLKTSTAMTTFPSKWFETCVWLPNVKGQICDTEVWKCLT